MTLACRRPRHRFAAPPSMFRRSFGDVDATSSMTTEEARWGESGPPRHACARRTPLMNSMRSSTSCRGVICPAAPGPPGERDDACSIDASGSKTAARWDRMALRAAAVRCGKSCLAGGALVFRMRSRPRRRGDRRWAKRREPPPAAGQARGTDGRNPIGDVQGQWSARLAPIFTRTGSMPHACRLSQPLHLVNFDGHDVVFTEIGYPLSPGCGRRDRAPPS